MTTQNLETIEVNFAYDLYENEKGYCIFHYTKCDTKAKITCVGNYLPKYKSIKYAMTGTYKKTEKYGLNFEVQTYKEIIENNEESIVGYLSSGLIKGVGKAIAERIYKEFGNESISVLEHHPEKYLKVKGITRKKLEKIEESYKENHVLRELIEYLLPYGITTKQVVRIYNEENIQSVAQLKEKPYAICNVHGITVITAGLLAKTFGYRMDSRDRLIAHVNHVLGENEANGNTGMYAEDFGIALLKSLKTPCFNKGNISGYTVDMIKAGIICHRKVKENGVIRTILYRTVAFRTEAKIAEKLIQLADYPQTQHEHIAEDISASCKEDGITLDEDQANAITTAITNSITVITGGPGAGKTTIIRKIADYLQTHEKKRRLYFMAPSGRASRRIKESTGYEATTIHKAENLRPGENYAAKEDKVEFDNATIIVDEFSMVDVFLANVLFDSINLGCRVILVGDVNQLPSVGPGSVLRDIIDSGSVPVIRLNHIHRQTDTSEIYQNGKKIVSGRHDIKEGSDFKIIQSDTPEQAQTKMVDHFIDYVNQYGIDKVYCLCPCKDNVAGVKAMNEVLQDRVNPYKYGDPEFKAFGYTYRIGDPVMHLKNNMEVSNGDIGYVTRIYDDGGDWTMVVTYFGDTEVSYTADNADEMTLAYAFTVHKAQGSENKIIITFLSRINGKKMLKRNLINTSITRGKSMVELFLTNDKALDMAIDNDDSNSRVTSLKDHLIYLSGTFVKVS